MMCIQVYSQSSLQKWTTLIHVEINAGVKKLLEQPVCLSMKYVKNIQELQSFYYFVFHRPINREVLCKGYCMNEAKAILHCTSLKASMTCIPMYNLIDKLYQNACLRVHLKNFSGKA